MQWAYIGTANWSARDSLRAFPHGSDIFMSNGWSNGGIIARDLWKITDPSSLTWTQVNNDTPYDKFSPIMSFDAGIMGSVSVQFDVWQNEWEKLSIVDRPYARHFPGFIAVDDEKLVLFGGNVTTTTTATSAVVYNDVLVLQ